MRKGALAPASMVLAFLPLATLAQSDASSRDPAFQFFAAQRLWAANWDNPFLDAKLVIPDPANPTPVIETSPVSSRVGTKVLPITVLGVAFGDFTLSASLSPSVSFGSGDAAGGEISRREYDVNLGYRLSPGIIASLIYNGGKASEVATAGAASLLGIRPEQKLSAWLVGLTASAPLRDRLSLYGNAAYGKGHAKLTSISGPLATLDPKNSLDYVIAEIGLTYQLGSLAAVNSISLQVGYRSQIVEVRNVEFPTFSAPPSPQVVSVANRRFQSNTHGFVIGLIASF